jgi:hypothetical protein
LYDHILISFGYPLTITIDQNTIINYSLSNWSFYTKTYQVQCPLST